MAERFIRHFEEKKLGRKIDAQMRDVLNEFATSHSMSVSDLYVALDEPNTKRDIILTENPTLLAELEEFAADRGLGLFRPKPPLGKRIANLVPRFREQPPANKKPA